MIPDKVYLQDGVSVPVVGFVSPAWENPKDRENPIEYIRKDALLEWAREKYKEYTYKQFEKHQDAVHWGQRNAFQQMIDKLNSM